MANGRQNDVPELWGVLADHHLRPTRTGGRIRALCPWCTDAGESPKKGKTFSAAANVDGNPWICFRCGRKGNARLVAAYYGHVESPSDRAARTARPAPPAPLAPSERIDQGWRQILEATTDADMARVEEWARVVRGWPAEIAAAVAQMDDVTAPDPLEVKGAQGRDIVAAAKKARRPLLIAIRDGQGRVRQVARRWMKPGPPPLREDGKPSQKSMALSADMTGDAETWGGIWTYGSLPEFMNAIELGEPGYIVEGAPDYLAASAVLQVRNDPGVVIGAYNTSTAKKLVEHIVRELGERGVVAPKIVLVPNIDAPRKRKDGTMPEHGVGMATFLEAGEILRGRGGVYLAEVPVEDGKPAGDVADLLAREGTDRVAMAMRHAAIIHRPPVMVADAGERIRERVLDAIREATGFKSSHGKKRLVILRVDAGAGKSWAALGAAADVARGLFYIPVNGRKPRGWDPTLAWPPKERSVVFACPDHELAEAKVREIEDLRPGARTTQIHGLLNYCMFAEKVEDLFPAVGRAGICGRPGNDEQRCHLADICPGAMEPKATRGYVTFCAHALLPSLKADLAIIDESPGVVTMLAEGKSGVAPGIREETLASLYSGKLIPRVKAWMNVRNPEAANGALLFFDAISPIAQRHAANVSSGAAEPFPRRIGGDELVRLIQSDPKLERAIFDGFRRNRKLLPPAPFPSEARDGFHAGRHMPNRIAFKAMVELADWLHRVGGYPDDGDGPGGAKDADALPIVGQGQKKDREPPRTVVAVRLETNGRWSIEVRQIKKLPDAPSLLIDAYGDLTEEEWRQAYPDWDIVFRRLDVQGAAPASAVHVVSQGFSRRKLLTDDGQLEGDAVPRLRKLVEHFAERVRRHYRHVELADPTEIAILTHKPIADALAGESVLSETSAGRAARRIVEDLEAKHFKVRIGYFGRHDRGQNEWQEVDGLLVIGDPFGNLGDTEEDAKLLDLDVGRVFRQRTAATCGQAMARARSIRRPKNLRVVLMFAGKTAPEIPGVIWGEEYLPATRGGGDGEGGAEGEGNGGAADETLTLRGLLVDIATIERVIGDAPLARFDCSKHEKWAKFRVSKHHAPERRRAVEALKKTMGWKTVELVMARVREANGLLAPAEVEYVDAKTLEDALAWAGRVGLVVERSRIVGAEDDAGEV